MIWSPFGKREKPAAGLPGSSAIEASLDEGGVSFKTEHADGTLGRPEPEAALLLAQMEEEGFADRLASGYRMSWADVYRALESREYGQSFSALGLPPVEAWRFSLGSAGSLTDSDFALRISGWIAPDGRRPQGNVGLEGAVLKCGSTRALLPRAGWEAIEALRAFGRGGCDGSAESNRRGWAVVRAKAVEAGADLSDFLKKTVVLTPEQLGLEMRKGDGAGTRLVEIRPGFEGQPPRWLEMFDRLDGVPDRYEIPDGEGLVHVIVPPAVKAVLAEIKAMPGRRVAGDRAEAFIRNPFAVLGPEAAGVIDPGAFEEAREDAGISFATFVASVLRDANGFPYEVSILIEETIRGETDVERVKFDGATELARFLRKLDERIASGAQCCHWEGFDLEILGDTSDQSAVLRKALADMEGSGGIASSEILDLSNYSERVEGFGAEKPYYSPFISRKSEDGGWFPENVEFGVCYTPEGGGETVALILGDETLADFKKAVVNAEKDGQREFDFPGCPKPVPTEWAMGMVVTLGMAIEDVGKGTFDPEKARAGGPAAERKGLVVKPNVDSLDYSERRGVLDIPASFAPPLPRSLKPEIELKDHQREGVRWLLNLWRLSPAECRGGLLADDMGLGKTIQLLTFIASAIEEDPNVAPFLVVAPVSLLENWREEIGKFFKEGSLPLLTLYGPDLAGKRVPKDAIEKELVAAGVGRLLRRDWLGGAKIVLTIYETLRDMEFSLAMTRWSAIVCDEAQKIKNPNALVTRSAKKQNARFRIACTGTPVENTLTDLWCLFDFAQPGLLGALKDFGSKYRKPIEVEKDQDEHSKAEGKARVDELRELIAPQLLRRTKAEVAKDLPRKIEVAECRSLPISERQRAHYADAIGVFRRKPKEGGPGIQNHLGLLQYLRRLCSDPKPPGAVSTDSTTLREIIAHSPKMAWMLRRLEEIRGLGEKVIVFCEFRDLQRTLKRAISDRFGLHPDIINGDTSAAASNSANRQRRIKAFQERPGFGVIILSPLAVGFGVNIQAANHVVHFTRTWNPSKEDQATDRAYRIGQTRDVFVYYPVVTADDFLTFDAKLDLLLEWKRELSRDMLNGAGDVTPADFGDLGAPGGGSAFGHEIITRGYLEGLDPDAFEAFCAILWSKLGYTRTVRTPQSGDGGVDVVAISGKNGVLIQCKSSSVDGRELSWEAVKDVVAGAAAYRERYPGVRFTLAAVTNRRFNGTAKGQAEINGVELIDGDGLAERMQEKPVRRSELAAWLFAGDGV